MAVFLVKLAVVVLRKLGAYAQVVHGFAEGPATVECEHLGKLPTTDLFQPVVGVRVSKGDGYLIDSIIVVV